VARNFDDHRKKKDEATRAEREFILGGEHFTARARVRPEAFMEWDSLDMETTPASEILEKADATILSMIEKKDNAHDRYRALREREDDALNLEDLTDLVQWLVEVQSGGRPTEPASDSSTSPDETGTSLTDSSPSPESKEEPELSTLGSS
jgi:hypothetical protein